MIKAVLIINTAGKIRLLSFYEKTISLAQQQELVRSIHRAITRRGDELCNFVDNFREWPTPDTRVIYRRYATLCFVFVTDSSESQLAILDLIQVFVESLDRTFENVCELDLIFHSEKVQYTLMEMIMGGMVLEMSRDEIIRSLGEMNRLSASTVADISPSRTLSGYH
ncbi:adaptor complex AP-3 small subunit, putative [Leishmania tarentolae]|uniref:AP complex subunit sigma n=1 Tax=Leishmania tarentolae TaxID=5689 RepID=A0A640KHR5_LEITA|nr:adaptor complex AP-3 small subunit, putative [Leishmania tarentolae]